MIQLDCSLLDCKSGVTTAPPSSMMIGANENQMRVGEEGSGSYLWISVLSDPADFDRKFRNKSNKSISKRHQMI